MATDPRHGMPCYRAGCRCAAGRAANAAKGRRARVAAARRVWHGQPVWVDGFRVARRLEALAAAGWPDARLAGQLGVGVAAVRHLRRHAARPAARVTWQSAGRVLSVYERLAAAPPADDRASRYAASHAAHAGWAPPWAWPAGSLDDPAAAPRRFDDDPPGVDVVAVEETIAGRRGLRLTRLERAEVAARMTARGYGNAAIADRLGVAARSAQTLRRRHGLTRPDQGVAA